MQVVEDSTTGKNETTEAEMFYSYTDELKGWVWAMQEDVGACRAYAVAEGKNETQACVVQFATDSKVYMMLPESDLCCEIAPVGPVFPSWVANFTYETTVPYGSEEKADVFEFQANQLNFYLMLADSHDITDSLGFGIIKPFFGFFFEQGTFEVAPQPPQYFAPQPMCASATSCSSSVSSSLAAFL